MLLLPLLCLGIEKLGGVHPSCTESTNPRLLSRFSLPRECSALNYGQSRGIATSLLPSGASILAFVWIKAA